VSLKKEYSIAWGLWALLWISMEVFFHAVPPAWWLALFITFLGVELIGAFRVKTGDTASEHVWAFIGDGWARGILAVGVGAGLALRAFSLPFVLRGDLPWGWLAWGPWACVCFGLAGWLAIHFPLKGREG